MLKRFFAVAFLLSITAFADIQVRDGLVSADLQSQPLTQVLDRLRTQADLNLMMDEGVAGKTVSANFQNLSIGMALKKMLEGTGINYVVLAGADGTPESVFIGGSTPPGSSPRQLDNRPVNSRGVVQPVMPPVPVPQPQQPETARPNPETKGYNPNVNIPTGGGFVPQTSQPPQPDQEQQEDQENPDDNSESN